MNYPFLGLYDSASEIYLYAMQLAIAIIEVILGILLVWRPRGIIELQIVLYRFINWKIEPISMEKEIRNTRIVGGTIFILGGALLVYVIAQQLSMVGYR